MHEKIIQENEQPAFLMNGEIMQSIYLILCILGAWALIRILHLFCLQLLISFSIPTCLVSGWPFVRPWQKHIDLWRIRDKWTCKWMGRYNSYDNNRRESYCRGFCFTVFSSKIKQYYSYWRGTTVVSASERRIWWMSFKSLGKTWIAFHKPLCVFLCLYLPLSYFTFCVKLTICTEIQFLRAGDKGLQNLCKETR